MHANLETYYIRKIIFMKEMQLSKIHNSKIQEVNEALKYASALYYK